MSSKSDLGTTSKARVKEEYYMSCSTEGRKPAELAYSKVIVYEVEAHHVGAGRVLDLLGHQG